MKRARPRPPDLADPADADRALIARLELLRLLTVDPRIQAAILAWAEGMRLATVVRGNGRRTRRAWADERATVGRQLLTALGSGGPWPGWLADWLADTALLMVYQDAREWRSVRVELEALGEPPYERRGRRPRGDGSSLARDVCWYYRARLRNPQESVTALAREYAARSNRLSDARSVVQDGILRAAVVLDLP